MADARPSRNRATVIIIVVLVVLGIGAAAGPLGGPGSPTGRAPGSASVARSFAASPPIANPPAASVPSPSPSSASPAPTAGAVALVEVAMVPVVATSSPLRSVSFDDLGALLEGRAARRVVISAQDLVSLSARLGVEPAATVRAAPPDALRTAIAGDKTAIGILRATDVTPEVRALAVDGRALFGAERVRSLAGWPLVVREALDQAGDGRFDPSAVWTLVAGGDVMLDRAAYRQAVMRGRGVDFPWNGGTAVVIGTRCCGAGGARLPVGRRTGDAGAVRTLLEAADVALVNLEGPAPDRWTYHPTGLVFSFDPALLAGLRHAGIDAVTIANNHIENAGAKGIADTRRHLDALDIGHAGAGPDLAAARRPAWLAAGGLRIAILGYDAIRPDLAATARRAGAAPLRLPLARADIRAARAAGADMVLVMPHWGVEYTDAVSATQRREAAALVAAGADAVIGSHSHWVGPVETIDGHPVLYSLGDLVFELTHDRRTMEGALADLTFVGSRLVQLDLHPTLILDGAQPNLLDPARDGARLLADVRRASAAIPQR